MASGFRLSNLGSCPQNTTIVKSPATDVTGLPEGTVRKKKHAKGDDYSEILGYCFHIVRTPFLKMLRNLVIFLMTWLFFPLVMHVSNQQMAIQDQQEILWRFAKSS